mmetsp:Transcript_44585/g.107433  ORF Transcript_44585/g.107433 Transcript_44585/m.107433 type:complete len:232 (-) Transcript_44585:103-798(-)
MIRGKGGAELGWMVAYAAEDYSFLKLSQLEKRLQARLPGLDLEIQGIVGGEQHVHKDLAPQNMTFTKADYPTLPNEVQNQEQEQEPLGHQSVVLMQWSDEEASTEKVVEYLKATLKEIHYKPQRFDILEDVGDGSVVFASYTKVVLSWCLMVANNWCSISSPTVRARSVSTSLSRLWRLCPMANCRWPCETSNLGELDVLSTFQKTFSLPITPWRLLKRIQLATADTVGSV